MRFGRAAPEVQDPDQVGFRFGIFARAQIDPAALQQRVHVQTVLLESGGQDLFGVAHAVHRKVRADQFRAQITVRRVGGGQFLEFRHGLIALSGFIKELRVDGLILLLRKGCNLSVGLLGLIRLPGLLLHGAEVDQRSAIFRVDHERLTELLFRLRRFALRQIERAQIDPGFW